MFVGARIILSEPAKILGICKGSVCGVGDLHLYHVGSKAAALLLASIFLLTSYYKFIKIIIIVRRRRNSVVI